MSDGLSQATLIIGATAIFASLAWSAGMVNTPQTQCDETVQVVSYLPVPALEPPLGWPIQERSRADDAQPVSEAITIKDDAEETPRRHHRRHRRRWR